MDPVSQTQGDDQQGQRDDSSVVSGKSVEADETVSEDRASRSEPAGDDLSAGTDTVGAVAADSAARGTISEGFSLWDADWFAAELVAGSTYVIEVLGAGAGADCTLRGPVLERVHDADGTPVTGTETWDDGRDSLTKLTFTPASPGTYFISVAGEANAAGTGTYILALTAAGPRSSERVAAIGTEGCVPTAPDNNANNNATSRIAPKKTPKPPPENTRNTARSSHNTGATLVSNINQTTTRPFDVPNAGADQGFTTGPTEPGQNVNGYVLTELEFFAGDFTRRDEISVSVWTDSNGSPGKNLAQRRLRGGGTTALVRLVVDGLDVFLLPETKYWIRFEEVGSLKLGHTSTGDEDSGGVAGRSIGEQPVGSIQFGLSGFAATAGSSEPSDGDLAASEETTGAVRVGQVSFGSLFEDDRVGVDDRLQTVETFTRDRDWFKLEGLQGGRLYRVEVDFLGDGVVGGGIQMQQSTLGRTPVARADMWDSNYDGNAVIDFRPIQSERVVTKWIMIESHNGMDNGPNRFDDRNYFTGDYTVTLTDITGLETMVSNTDQRAVDRLVFSDVGHLHDQEPEFLGHFREVATSFTTDSGHSAGYALDSITAYMQAGRRAAATTIETSIIDIVDDPEDDDDGSDLVTFSQDSIDITLTSATIVSTNAEPAVSIHSDNSGAPGDKVCELEGLDGYDTGLVLLPTGDWPDRLYAGGCADITLTASTTYWIVFHSSEWLPSSYYLVARANSTSEDPGNNAGWSIGDYAKMRLYTNTGIGEWEDRTYRLAVGVHATPK